MLRHVEEVGTAQMFVAFRHPRVDRARIDRDVGRRFRHVRLVVHDLPGDFFEFPPHRGDHQVPHLEVDPGVGRVELPWSRMEKPRRHEAKDRRRKDHPSAHSSLLILQVLIPYKGEIQECAGGLHEIE
jgi:hypothetical protein